MPAPLPSPPIKIHRKWQDIRLNECNGKVEKDSSRSVPAASLPLATKKQTRHYKTVSFESGDILYAIRQRQVLMEKGQKQLSRMQSVISLHHPPDAIPDASPHSPLCRPWNSWPMTFKEIYDGAILPREEPLRLFLFSR
ncbi:hypothetical protein [Pseudodesulfovibrio piezophilus]|nr:hypothetical protein [Pseudodesulfovibrio piezophilus]